MTMCLGSFIAIKVCQLNSARFHYLLLMTESLLIERDFVVNFRNDDSVKYMQNESIKKKKRQTYLVHQHLETLINILSFFIMASSGQRVTETECKTLQRPGRAKGSSSATVMTARDHSMLPQISPCGRLSKEISAHQIF